MRTLMRILGRRTFLKYSAAFTTAAITNGITLPSTVAETGRGVSHPFFTQAKSRPEVIAHQGGKGQWPGETIFALDQANKLGADVLEFDVHSTRDGNLVLMHNATVDETTNGRGRINRMLLKDLKKLDAGYRWTANGGRTFPFRGKNIEVPTLEEVFQKFKNKRMNIEIKQSEPSIIAPLSALIEKHSMEDKVLVASFSNRDLELFRARCPRVATSASPQELVKFRWGSNSPFPTGSRPDCLQVKDKVLAVRVITPDSVAKARRLNLPLHAFTVNDIERMKKMIALEVDGIITDYPGLLLALLERGGR